LGKKVRTTEWPKGLAQIEEDDEERKGDGGEGGERRREGYERKRTRKMEDDVDE
jgi:hypothetical protein